MSRSTTSKGVEGPAFIGNYCTVSPESSVGPYTVLGPGTTLRERARVSRSVIDASCYIGRSATIEGAILGRNCDVRPHARVHEGVAVGDQVTLGDQSVIFPGVRIYPYKEVEYGAQIHESLIWESRGTTKVFAQDGVVGLVNVDLTPEVALRVGAALGTALKRGARVVASRESAPAYRMIKRALISGLNSTGVQVADLRTLPAPVGKHLLKTQNYDAAFHVGASTTDPEAVQIRLFERPGVALSEAMQKEIEKHFTRQELRRVPFGAVGSIAYPARARESYASDLVDDLDVAAIRERGFRIVVDYGYSGGSFVLPLVFGPARGRGGDRSCLRVGRRLRAGPLRSDARLCAAARRGGERRLRGRLRPFRGAALPDRRDRPRGAAGSGAPAVPPPAGDGHHGNASPCRSPRRARSRRWSATGSRSFARTATLAGLTQAAAGDGVVFAGAPGGGYVFPGFLPAYDASASLCKLLELLAPVDQPLSKLVAALPRPTLDPSPAAVSVGAEGHGHARPQRAVRRRERGSA